MLELTNLLANPVLELTNLFANPPTANEIRIDAGFARKLRQANAGYWNHSHGTTGRPFTSFVSLGNRLQSAQPKMVGSFLDLAMVAT